MDAKLLVVGGEAKSAEIQLQLPTIVGRGSEAALTLPHPLVSRQHCEIYESEGQLMVRDLDSLNGTFINNARITGEAVLRPRELLTVGVVTFRAIYGEESEGEGHDSQSPEKVRTNDKTVMGTFVQSIVQTNAAPKAATEVSGSLDSELPATIDLSATVNPAIVNPATSNPAPELLQQESPAGDSLDKDERETEALCSDTDIKNNPPDEEDA